MGFGFTVWIFYGVWNFCLDFLWGDGGWCLWIDGGLMVVAGWLGVGDFGFVLGLWEGYREEEREENNKKCKKKKEYFIE